MILTFKVKEAKTNENVSQKQWREKVLAIWVAKCISENWEHVDVSAEGKTAVPGRYLRLAVLVTLLNDGKLIGC